MKSTNKHTKKLSLYRETLRLISNPALARIGGGDAASEPTTHYTETTKSSNQSTNWSTTCVSAHCGK